jgi:hypothetical protein
VSEILLDLGPTALRRTAEDSQFLSRPDKVSQGPRPHLLHDVTAMDLDGFFGCAQLMGDLLVEHTRYDMSHHLNERLVLRDMRLRPDKEPSLVFWNFVHRIDAVHHQVQ